MFLSIIKVTFGSSNQLDYIGQTYIMLI